MRQFATTSAPAAPTAFTTIPISIQITPAPIVPPPPVDTAPVTQTVARASCPPPRTDAAQIPRKHELPHGVSHVTTSLTNAGWIAAWSNERVHVSLDGGLTFAQVLDGPGDVRDVTFDCFGHPIVLRAGKVGVRDGTRETWREVPGMRTDNDAPAALVGGGPDVIALIVGDEATWKSRMAVSPDLGQSWWFRELIDYWETSTATGRQDADGTIHLALTTADCMSDPVFWLRIEDGIVERDSLGSVGQVELYGDYALSAGYNGVLWKKFGEEEWHPVKNPPGLEDAHDARLLAGPLPRVIIGNAIYTYARGRLSPLRPWTADRETAAVDRAGRLWGIAETKDGEDAWLVAVPNARAKIPPPDSGPDNE
ncbi:MAG: hypothetical protein HOV81_20010 [Kofleriaceae bacterium]|nr:hypothetical protein [Kofleriaceae bacterium]